MLSRSDNCVCISVCTFCIHGASVAACKGVVDLSLTLSASIRTPEPAIIPCRTIRGKHYIPHKIDEQPLRPSPSVRQIPLYTNRRTVQPIVYRNGVFFSAFLRFSPRGTLGGAEALRRAGAVCLAGLWASRFRGAIIHQLPPAWLAVVYQSGQLLPPAG